MKRRVLALSLLAGALLVFGAVRARRAKRSEGPLPVFRVLSVGDLSMRLHSDGKLYIARGAVTHFARLSLLVREAGRPLELTFGAVEKDRLSASTEASLHGKKLPMTVSVRMTGDEMCATVSSTEEPLSLVSEVVFDKETPFVAGAGELAAGHVSKTPYVLFQVHEDLLGVSSPEGPVESLGHTLVTESSEPFVIQLRSPAGSRTTQCFAVGPLSSETLSRVYQTANVEAVRVTGRVTGGSGVARIVGRDVHGTPEVIAASEPDGTFSFSAPKTSVEFYALYSQAHTSLLVPYTPGSDVPLVLDVSPGGELRVRILEKGTNHPLTARLMVRGVEGTLDPNFGPDYRASGAGPLVDVLRGEVETPLPSGRYRVLATKGIEYTLDEKRDVTIESGLATEVTLSLERVVPTPAAVAADLHVHARPSFDTPVSMEDRVLSLVSAGIEFAVPTEHNIVGDYSSAVEALGLSELSWIHGVEVTTYGRGFGHFGVFPYPPEQKVPPYRGTSFGAVLAQARVGDPERKRFVQIHHPRFPKGIGYFQIIGFQGKLAKATAKGRMDFDGIEVFNGYDLESHARVRAVLEDYWALLNLGYRYVVTGSSDSHRIQFHWAGYPRTMVLVNEGEHDPQAIVHAIKEGHVYVTSGPILEWQLAGKGPGDEIRSSDTTLSGHLRVRAAPWVDVRRVEIVVGGRVVETLPVPERETQTGEEKGSQEEIQGRTIRLDQNIEIPVPAENTWVQIVVSGERRMDDVLAFMPAAPLAFTNPIYVVRYEPPPLPTLLTPPPSVKKP